MSLTTEGVRDIFTKPIILDPQPSEMTNTADFSQPSTLVTWSPDWREVDLITGLAIDVSGNQELLDPTTIGTTSRDGVQLADVTVQGSPGPDRIFAGIGSTIIGAGGSDELFNTDSLGSNLLVGGPGMDRLFLQPVQDLAIGGELLLDAEKYSLPYASALVDGERDNFLIDSANPGSDGPLHILDFEVDIDELLIDGRAPTGNWASIKSQLIPLNVIINAAPKLSEAPIIISLQPGIAASEDLNAFASDLDDDNLRLFVLQGPSWVSASGSTLTVMAPVDITAEDLESTELILGFTDGKAVIEAAASFKFIPPPSPVAPQLSVSPVNSDQSEGNSGQTPFTFRVSRSGDLSGTSTAAWNIAGSGNRPANPADFTGSGFPSGTVTFAAGEAFKTIAINVNGDNAVEQDETFAISLRGAEGSTINPSASSAFGVIRNDDIQSQRPNTPTRPEGTPRPRVNLRASKRVDTLLGSDGKDTFIFKGAQSSSIRSQVRYDTIINYDQRDSLKFKGYKEVVLGNPGSRRIMDLQGTANKLTFKSIDNILGNGFRKKAIAALEVDGFDGTFVAVSGGRPGFDSKDLLIFLEGYNLQQDGPIQLA